MNEKGWREHRGERQWLLNVATASPHTSNGNENTKNH